MQNEKHNIFIYGSGNMAWALASNFSRVGISLAGIAGRNTEAVKELCHRLVVEHCEDILTQSKEGDIVFLAVNDDALSELNESLSLPGRLVLHTSGSVDISAISAISEHIGVFYPMERLIKFQQISLKTSPLCIEVGSQDWDRIIYGLANAISDKVFRLSSLQRKHLHIAAVFVSNFTTYMLSAGNDLLKKYDLPETILDSLVKTTFEGLTTQNASFRQTGPAKRADINIIKEHINLLQKDFPELSDTYRILSESILNRYKSGQN